MNKIKTRIADLKDGDLVTDHGGTFQVLFDSIPSEGHRDRHWNPRECIHELHEGPVNCAYTSAECIDGEVPGYFKPGSEWTFQGATAVTVHRVGAA